MFDVLTSCPDCTAFYHWFVSVCCWISECFRSDFFYVGLLIGVVLLVVIAINY